MSDVETSVAAVVLAAGRGARMGGANKMAIPLGDVPVLRRTVDAALASTLRPILVVTGHEPEAAHAVLTGCDVTFVHNPQWSEGLSTSLAAGIRAVPASAAGAAILLGDMPLVSAAVLGRLAEAVRSGEDIDAAAPVRAGRRGNPVVWSRRLFPQLLNLTGDAGARSLLESGLVRVMEMAVEDDGPFSDIDSRDDLERLELHLLAERYSGDASAALDGMRSEDA